MALSGRTSVGFSMSDDLGYWRLIGKEEELALCKQYGSNTRALKKKLFEDHYNRFLPFWLILGTSRGGQHAVLHWLFQYLPPFVGLTAMGPHKAIAPSGIMVNYKEPVKPIMTVGHVADKSLIVCPDELLDEASRTIIILRDVYNTAASLARGMAPAMLARVLEVWPKVAMDILRDTFFISFNSWFVDRGYRSKTLERLNLCSEDADKGTSMISPMWRASSFDGRTFDGKAQQMDILGRWRSMDKSIWSMISEESKELSRVLFGEEFLD